MGLAFRSATSCSVLPYVGPRPAVPATLTSNEERWDPTLARGAQPRQRVYFTSAWIGTVGLADVILTCSSL